MCIIKINKVIYKIKLKRVYITLLIVQVEKQSFNIFNLYFRVNEQIQKLK